MKRKQIKTFKDYEDLIEFLAVNAHNIIIDCHVPGDMVDKVDIFLKKCREISDQLKMRETNE